MGKSPRRKELLDAYRARRVVGGVCAIQNTATGRTLLYAAPNPEGQRNRFAFSVSTGTCILAALAADWREYGPDRFSFQVLEELERTPEQTDLTFREDLEALTDMWRERLSAAGALFY